MPMNVQQVQRSAAFSSSIAQLGTRLCLLGQRQETGPSDKGCHLRHRVGEGKNKRSNAKQMRHGHSLDTLLGSVALSALDVILSKTAACSGCQRDNVPGCGCW